MTPERCVTCGCVGAPEPVEARACPYCDRTESHDHCIECEAMNALPWQHAKWCSHFRPTTDFDTPEAAEPVEARDLTADKTVVIEALAEWLHHEDHTGRAIHEDAYAMQVPSYGADECGVCQRLAHGLYAELTKGRARAALRADTARVPEGLREAIQRLDEHLEEHYGISPGKDGDYLYGGLVHGIVLAALAASSDGTD